MMGGLAAFAAASLASAQDARVGAVRIGADDVPAAAAFYAETFGLREVLRFEFGDTQEIIMNFGATEEAAAANTGAQVVIMTRPADAVADPMAHLIFRVDDMAASIARIEANGGTVETPPQTIGGTSFAYTRDPQGNMVELLATAPAAQ
jgi:predicted enzyme related to lactoylglutathione lyase